MKNIIKTIVLLLTISSCKAQSNIINITDWSKLSLSGSSIQSITETPCN